MFIGAIGCDFDADQQWCRRLSCAVLAAYTNIKFIVQYPGPIFFFLPCCLFYVNGLGLGWRFDVFVIVRLSIH